MILILFFASILSHLPLHSATYDTTSNHTCPKSFTCPGFPPFGYPFYKTTDPQCGFIKVRCTPKGADIQIGNRSYKIAGPIRSITNASFLVHNREFEKLLKNQSCEALLYDFTSPEPLLYSISIHPFIRFIRCTKKRNFREKMDDYFDPGSYYRYKGCKDYDFYYKNSITNMTVPSDISDRCEVIELPAVRWPDGSKAPKDSDIFTLLASNFSIFFHLTSSCSDCRKKEGLCQTHNGNFLCLDHKKGSRKLILIAVLAGSTGILMLSSVMLIMWRRHKRNPFSYFSSKGKSGDPEDSSIFYGVPVFSYNQLKDATQNFDPCQELGDGGFGAVYYGKLQDGREVAVKRLYEHNYKRVQQFMNEIEILTRLRHKNLVLLYGCTSRRSRELLLVYEYIPNGTVADHLHGEQANRSVLTWPIRMNIAIETASALVYLHASEIIHRDVKTNNILVDHSFNVKVADFGLSRLLPNDVSHVSTAPQGTPGYVDPQYHQCFQLTDKSDVYSFGVVLVELITAMEAVDISRAREEISLANLAINRIQRCEFDQLIDPALGSDSNDATNMMITLVVELAFRCLQYDSDLRPRMNEVLDVLENIQAAGELKNLPPSPVSVTGKWYSNSSRSST